MHLPFVSTIIKNFFKKNLYRTFFLKIPVLTSFVSSRCCWYLYVYVCTVAEERQLTIPWVAFLWHLFTDFSKMLKIFSWKCFRHNANMYFVVRTYSAYVLFGFGSSPKFCTKNAHIYCRKIEKCNNPIIVVVLK